MTGLPRSAYTPGWVRLCVIRRWPCCLRGERIQLPCRSTVPFGSSLSASLARSFLTTFTSSSPLLAIPSDPSSRTALMLAVAISPHGLMTIPKDEATLSPELHTAGLLQLHVWVGYWWQNTRLCPDRSGITAVYATSCRTNPRKSKPSVRWRMWGFSSDHRNPRIPSHVARRCWASIAACLVGHKTAPSSAYLTKAYVPRSVPRGV
jgi:hypothetical protein